MLGIASYFVFLLLFQVAHQSFDGGSQLLNRAAQLRSLRRSSSMIEASAGKQLVESAPPETCPVCLQSFNDTTWKMLPKNIQVKKWKGCRHRYHSQCYKGMIDRQQPCAMCRAPCPPLSTARLKRLASKPRTPPSETDQDETAAWEVLQTDVDLAELVPDINTTRGDGAFTSGSSHTHESASGSAMIHEDDEALARVFSFPFQQEARHHPGPAGIMSDEPQHSWCRPDTSADQDLALALSLQDEFIWESQGGNSASSIHDALPELANAWSAPETSRDAEYARQIERELNEQRPLLPRSRSQGHPQPARPGYPELMRERSTQPMPQRSTQPFPPGYPAPSMHQGGYLQPVSCADGACRPSLPPGYPGFGAVSHPQPVFCADGACGPNPPLGYPPYEAANHGHPQPVFCADGVCGSSQPLAYPPSGAANYDHQSMAEWSGGSPGALQSFERGIGQFQPTSIIERIHDVLPQVLTVGLCILMYYMFFRCKNC